MEESGKLVRYWSRFDELYSQYVMYMKVDQVVKGGKVAKRTIEFGCTPEDIRDIIETLASEGLYPYNA